MKYLRLFPYLTIISLILFGCKQGESGTAKAVSEPQDSVAKEILVRTTPLTRTTISRTIDYTATLIPFEEVYVAPAAPGRIEKLYVEVGDRIVKGQKLFLMDQSQIRQAEIQLKSLAVDLGRLDTLLSTGSVTQQQYDQLKTQYDVTASNIAFMKENTLLYAPFDGVVTGKYYENGEMFSGAPNTMAGKAAVVTVNQVNKLKALVGISEQYFPQIKEGMNADIKVDVYGSEEFAGKITLVYPTIDPATRTFNVEIDIPNGSNRLKPGMFIRVSMELGEAETFVVPANALLQQEGTNIRYLFIEKDGKAVRQNVVPGKRFDDRIEVISDRIKEGEHLIIEGQTKLIDGNVVKVVK